MKILIYLHHPSQFHVFKNVIDALKNKHELTIIATKKDILEDLLIKQGIPYINFLPNGRKDNKISIALGLLKQDLNLLKYCIRNRPDLMVGTSTEICHVGFLLNIPNIFVNEDDANIVPLVKKLAHPFARHLLSPDVCNTENEAKKISYPGYQKLAYLHPNRFIPLRSIVEQYFTLEKPYFLLRFAKLKAHHDNNVKGLDTVIARKVIDILSSYGDVYISSERTLEPEFEKYRLDINPLDIHHVMYYSNIYIGDSQSMAVEAAILGVPSIRFSDFSGKISVLEELEHTYNLTYGVRTNEPDRLLRIITELAAQPNIKDEFAKRRAKMVADKIDVAAFFTWLIENYPNSVDELESAPGLQSRFQ